MLILNHRDWADTELGARPEGRAGVAIQQPYEDYVASKQCQLPSDNSCLEATTYVATRSDGSHEQVSGVYQWRNVGQAPGLLLPHFLLEYMRRLRNAYNSVPEAYREQLDNQINFLISSRVSDDSNEALRAVDRNGALVWENNQGVVV